MDPIVVIPKSTAHMLWRAVEAGAREGAREAGVEMIWKGSLKEDDGDVAQQIQIVQQFVSDGVTALFWRRLTKQRSGDQSLLRCGKEFQ
jgi:ribose transport system substrate-binding protein